MREGNCATPLVACRLQEIRMTRFSAKPLVEFYFKKGENGWKLEEVKLGFLTKQGKLWERNNNNATDNGAAEPCLLWSPAPPSWAPCSWR